jgi:hypothetical protein
MTDQAPPPAEDGGDDIGTVVLMLSLYLIMLAFFILLNAISEDSQSKSEVAMESIQEGFSFRTDGEATYDDPVPSVEVPAYDHVAMNLKGIIEAYLSLEEFKFKHEEKKMHVYIEANRFFEEGGLLIRADMVNFLTDLAGLLAHEHYGMKIVSELRVHAHTKGVYPPVEMAGRRATLLVRALEDRGVDKSNLSATAILDTRDEVELYFELVEVGDAESMQTMKDLGKLMQEQMR